MRNVILFFLAWVWVQYSLHCLHGEVKKYNTKNKLQTPTKVLSISENVFLHETLTCINKN